MLRASRRKVGVSSLGDRSARRSDRGRRPLLALESLEGRALLSVSAAPIGRVSSPSAMVDVPAVGDSPAGLSANYSGAIPAQITSAYGVSTTAFLGLAGTGSGQTIAIVDAYNDPNIVNDVNQFDSYWNLPAINLVRINQAGGQSYPANAPLPTSPSQGSWGEETSLDVEWAHVIAPGATILLVETNSASPSDLYQGVAEARGYSGVSVVSMSWGGFEDAGAPVDESLFTTPSGHNGVTFLAATGDSGGKDPVTGAASVQYPASSANVVALGGTSLAINGYAYSGESAWSYSGGGVSTLVAKPSYQDGVNSGTKRSTPDVSMLADPNYTGVGIYDSYDFGASNGDVWIQEGGTSLAAPMWAGLIAIADQFRAYDGLGTLDGPSQTLPELYSLPATDFHDVFTGGNGVENATYGYDMVTGRGTPIANLLVNDLASTASVVLPTNAILRANQLIATPNGLYDLIMQADGNLVEYGPGGSAIWDSGTGGNSGAYAWMQADGNLVVYSGAGQALWSTGTSGNSDGYLTVQYNGTATIEQSDGNPIFVANTYALPGRIIEPGQFLFSANFQYDLTMQADGNLVEYGPDGQVIFASQTSGHPGAYATMQVDGNFVVYFGGEALFYSGTQGNSYASAYLLTNGVLGIYAAGGLSDLLWNDDYTAFGGRYLFAGQFLLSANGEYILEMLSDGDLVEYGPGGQIIFATNTSSNGAYAEMQADGNFVVYSAAGQALWSTGTSNHPGALLTLQGNGQLVITYDGSTIDTF